MAPSNTLHFDFLHEEQARQAMKGIFGAYPTHGYTDSDAEGNPSPQLPIFKDGTQIAMVSYETVDRNKGVIIISFQSDGELSDPQKVVAITVKHFAGKFEGTAREPDKQSGQGFGSR